MTRIVDFHASLEAYHQQRKIQERELGWWLVGFALTQSVRLAAWLVLFVAAYALMTGNWAVFSAFNALCAISILGPVGAFFAWRKIQAA